MRIEGKHIILGVTGSISAYKSAAIASHLTQLGAHVDVIMTKNACQFITPMTFETLTHRRVFTDTFENDFTGEVAHIGLARSADLVLIAPASANLIGKLAHGIADDMLTTTLLAVKAPVWLAPAMNSDMFEHIAVQENLALLRKRGLHIIEPASGLLACGTCGRGRMPEPDSLVERVVQEIALEKKLRGKHVLVSAGATREFLDAVRFLSNPSTGKMGLACARVARMMGAEVTLVCGHLEVPVPDGMRVIRVTSAAELGEAMFEQADRADMVIMTAAVSDFTPREQVTHKVHKTDAETNIAFIPTTDILKTLGARKRDGQFVCGFCMETDDLVARAEQKLRTKNADMIVANALNAPGCGFGHDTNGVTLVTRHDKIQLPLASKEDVALQIFEKILEMTHQAL